MPVRFGVLGAASIARRKMLPAMMAEPDVEVVAIASRCVDRAAELTAQFGGEALADYAALLGRTDVDAVYLPLPSGLHGRWATQALQAGKHVLVEKPLATNLAQARSLVALARARDRQLCENFAFVEHRQHRQILDLLDRGAIGDLRTVTAEFAIPPLPAGDIRYQRNLGGGALLDTGVYPLRTATMLLGDGLRVVGSAGERPAPTGVDLAGAALLVAPNGVTVSISYGFVHAYRSSYSLWGSGGRLSLHQAYTPSPELRPTATLETADGATVLRLDCDDQFRARLRRFVTAVTTTERPFDHEITEQARLLHAVADGLGLLGMR